MQDTAGVSPQITCNQYRYECTCVCMSAYKCTWMGVCLSVSWVKGTSGPKQRKNHSTLERASVIDSENVG